MCSWGGGIIYRSYATYQENKSYNVIKGTIPDFGYDIKLAYTINGEKDNNNSFPSKESEYVGQKVTCKNNVTAEWDNINWGLKNITNANNSETIRCTVDFKAKETFSEKVKAGDYVKMTPIAESYTISKELTGYESDQTINPSELNLWRVLQINSNGTIEIISEYTSSNYIYFKGEASYKNYIGVLNMIASAYTNSTYTMGSRYPGYRGQTEFITGSLSEETSGTVITGHTGWNPSTESYGGGDTIYYDDFKLIKQNLGTLDVYIHGTQTIPTYLAWAGRIHLTENIKCWAIRCLSYTPEVGEVYTNNDCLYDSLNQANSRYHEYYLRPIVLLKTNLEAISGDGSSDHPWTFE